MARKIKEVEPTKEQLQASLRRTIMNNARELWGKKLATIPTELLSMDYSYQRVATTNVKYLAENWENERCDFLTVSYRDNKFYVIDGQHRYYAALRRQIPDLPCIIFTGLTQNDEARVFAKQNNGVRKLTPFDTFKANVTCGNRNIPDVKIDCEVNDILSRYGLEVKKANSKVHNKCVRSLTRCRRITKAKGTAALEWIISTICNSNWEDFALSYKSEIFEAMSILYTREKENGTLPEATERVTAWMNTHSPAEALGIAKVTYPDMAATKAVTKMFLSI